MKKGYLLTVLLTWVLVLFVSSAVRVAPWWGATAWVLWEQKDYGGSRGEYAPLRSYSKAECEKTEQRLEAAEEKKLKNKLNSREISDEPSYVSYFYCFPSDFDPREQKGNWILWVRYNDYAPTDSALTRGRCEDLRYEGYRLYRNMLEAGANPKLPEYFCFPSDFDPRGPR